MLRIAICDDNRDFLQNAVSFIKKWSEQSGIPVKLFTYDNGDSLIGGTSAIRMDIIFLDIIMPMLNGMDTARELRQRDASVRIIFLTSSPEFALESYAVKAQGYILMHLKKNRKISCLRRHTAIKSCISTISNMQKLRISG